jgi:hypothetical protein
MTNPKITCTALLTVKNSSCEVSLKREIPALVHTSEVRMAASTITEDQENNSVCPFVLKWAESAPESSFWSHRSLFCSAVNGLDIYLVTEGDKPESTGNPETADCTNTNV